MLASYQNSSIAYSNQVLHLINTSGSQGYRKLLVVGFYENIGKTYMHNKNI